MTFKHLKKVRQSYVEHFIFAVKWGGYLIWTGILSAVHGLIPSLFPFSAPRNVLKVSELIRRRRVPGEFPEDMITRERIGTTFKISDESGVVLNRDEFFQVIDGCKAWLRPWVKPGMQVAVYADNSIVVYAMGFALWELGVCFFGDSFKERVIDRALNAVKVDAIFADSEYADETKNKIQGHCRVETFPTLDYFLKNDFPPDSEIHGQATDAILMGYTSGSTGEPLKVYHNHRSLLAPSLYMAAKYFPIGSRTLIYLNLNQLGYISCILLPAFWSGCEIHVVRGSAPRRIVTAIEKIRPEILPLFTYNWMTIVELFPDLSLHGVRTVLTGGDLLSREFVEQALNRGAERVLDIYGMTEALPPISIEEISKDNLSTFKSGVLGTLVPYVEVRIRNDEIFVKGQNTPHNLWVSSGDRGHLDGNKLSIHGRSKYFIQTGEKEISCNDIRSFLRGLMIDGKPLTDQIKGDGFLVFPFKNLLVGVLALKNADDSKTMTKDFFNQKIAKRFGPEIQIDELIYKKDMPFNGIKINIQALMPELESLSYPVGHTDFTSSV